MSSRSKRHRKSAVVTTALVPVEQKSARPGCPQPCGIEPPLRGDRPLPSREAVAVRAREIWDARGRPTGQDLKIWFAAEGELFGRST
jgi:hypothetical protein